MDMADIKQAMVNNNSEDYASKSEAIKDRTTQETTVTRKRSSSNELNGAAKQDDPRASIDHIDIRSALNRIENHYELQPASAEHIPANSHVQVASSSTASSEHSQSIEAMKRLDMLDIMASLASSGKNAKDMASHKFWKTQPIPHFNETSLDDVEDGPIKFQDIKNIPTSPLELAIDGFRWVTLDLTDDDEMKEVYDLLNRHYVEDDDGTLRFNYSTSLMKWALMSPAWKRQWHLGIRVGRTLCAFISAIPVSLRVRKKTMQAAEVNFLCIHKKLRSKRLAPVMIQEISRLCNLEGVWQAIYTAGIVLPRPVSTCRYFHRALNWEKLYEVGFSSLPLNSKPAYQIRKYAVPNHTSTKGLREMQAKDLNAVQSLLQRYLDRFDIAPEFSLEECEHWLLHKKDSVDDQVIWSYVVEDASKKITDFFSFYSLSSSVINQSKHSVIRAAFLFYYASETALTTPFDKLRLKERLNALMADALILAKQYKFDVFNAMSLMDNGLFLEQQKFGPGTSQLHYYLFNYRTNPIAGGVDKRNQLDGGLSGVGLVMP